jgi:hypothetical protein
MVDVWILYQYKTFSPENSDGESRQKQFSENPSGFLKLCKKGCSTNFRGSSAQSSPSSFSRIAN